VFFGALSHDPVCPDCGKPHNAKQGCLTQLNAKRVLDELEPANRQLAGILKALKAIPKLGPEQGKAAFAQHLDTMGQIVGTLNGALTAKQSKWGPPKAGKVVKAHPQVDKLQPLKEVEVLATTLTIQNGGQSGATCPPKRAAAVRIREALAAQGLPAECCIKHATAGIPPCPDDAACRGGYTHEKRHANKLPARSVVSPAAQGTRAGAPPPEAAGLRVCRRVGCDRICTQKRADGGLHPYCGRECADQVMKTTQRSSLLVHSKFM
jgi:hypothetical protein